MKRIILILISCMYFIAARAPEMPFLAIISPETINRVFSIDDCLKAIIEVEAGGGSRYNKNEPLAVGILQQYPIFVRDVNRILGRQVFSLDDRNNDNKAIQMFWIYQNHYNPGMSFEKMCKMQCGGPSGMQKTCTEHYYQLVRDKLFKCL